MLSARLYVVVSMYLLAFISSATADPFCDGLFYGHPTFSDCLDLVHDLDKDSPEQLIPDRRQRFFSLRGEATPEWIPFSARGLRTNLPILVAKGNCKLAMTAIRLRNETITSDYAYWHDLWLDAFSTLIGCVELPEGTGGYHHVGTLRRLILTLYAPGSIYDLQIHQIIHRHGVVCSREFVPKDTLINDSDFISGSVGCNASPELTIQGPLLECCNASTGRAQSIKRRNGTVCVSCGVDLDAKS